MAHSNGLTKSGRAGKARKVQEFLLFPSFPTRPLNSLLNVLSASGALRPRLAILAAIAGACARGDTGADTGSTGARDSAAAAAPAATPAAPAVGGVVVDSALTEPQLVLHGDHYRLHLPPAMNAALVAKGVTDIPQQSDYLPAVRQYASDVGPRQALFAAIGDFDGDRRDDAVVHARVRGRPDSSQLVLALLNDSTGARAVEVEKYPLYSGPLGEYLLYQKAETLRSPHEKAPVTLTTDAFQVVFFEKAAKLYYYRNGKFNPYFTSD